MAEAHRDVGLVRPRVPTSNLLGNGAAHRGIELDLNHLRLLAARRLDEEVLNFAFSQDDEVLRRLGREYLVLGSLLRAASHRLRKYLRQDQATQDIEALVSFCVTILSHAEIPVKIPAAPAFQDFLSSTIEWLRSLRNTVYVGHFWDSMYAMLTMDLASQPGIRERILGEVADIGRSVLIPAHLSEILAAYAERPYLFGDPRQYLRLIAYILKQFTLGADVSALSEKWLSVWIGYLGSVKFADKNHRREQFEMKDDVHRGIGYLTGLRAILTGRYGGFFVSMQLLLVKLDHLLVARYRAGHTFYGRIVFKLIGAFWRTARNRRRIHIQGEQIPLRNIPPDNYRNQLEVLDVPILSASKRAIVITRVQGGLGDIMMMRPGLLELAKRRPSFRVYFATNRSFFAAFSVDDPVTLVDIETTRIDLKSFRRWYNFSNCPATRVERREHPRIQTNRIDIFARAMGVRFGRFSNRTRAYQFPSDAEARAKELVQENHRPGTLKIGIQYKSAETYRDIPAIIGIARDLAKNHTVFLIDSARIPMQDGDKFIPVFGEKLQVALALVSMMDFTIGPDSSFFHIAGANRVPGIALFGPTSGKVRTKAYPTIRHIDMEKDMACVPCWRNEFSPCKVSGGFDSICTKALTLPIILGQINPVLELMSRRITVSSPQSA